jgi:hypothetical protein
MSDLPQSTVCPFGELLDKRILGDFTPEDRARLEEHLKQGCPSCAERWKTEEKLESTIEDVITPLAREAERRKPFVLDKLKEQLAKEDALRSGRRRRRVGLNAALMLILLLGVTLLSAEYLAYYPVRLRLLQARKAAAFTEETSMLVGLHKLYEQRGKEALPRNAGELVKALGQRRIEVARPYFTPTKVDDNLAVDPWGHPYVYKLVPDVGTPTEIRVYSIGPNGIDEDGLGDDIEIRLALPR